MSTLARITIATIAALLASCQRTVPLRIGPAGLASGVAAIELRVWSGATCPSASDAAASPDRSSVSILRYYGAVPGGAAVGAAPSGAHAVSVLARDATCGALLYGCTPSVDFGSASTIDVVWSAVSPSFACGAGMLCDGGDCFVPRRAEDAGSHE